MKALSVRQPWAWAILHAGKRIENRERKDGAMPAVCHHEGPLLIHASAGVGSLAEFSAAADFVSQLTDEEAWIAFRDKHLNLKPWRGSTLWRPRSSLSKGGIVGVCNVVGHILPDGNLCGKIGGLVDLRWHKAGSYGLVLADVRPLPFMRWKGTLGLFDVPDALVSKALAETASLRGGQ